MQRHLVPPASGEHRLGVQVRNGLDDLQELALTLTTSDPVTVGAQVSLVDPIVEQEFRFQLDHPLVVERSRPRPGSGALGH